MEKDENKSITINITTGTVARSILLILLVVFLFYVRNLLMIVLFSIVIASGVEPVAVWLHDRKIPRTIAVIFIYLMAFSLLGAIFYFVIPTIFSEFYSFASKTSLYLEQPSAPDIFSGFISSLPSSISVALNDFSITATEYIGGFTTGFFSTAAKIFGGALSFILMIVLSFYLSVQKNGIENFLRLITSLQHEEYIIGLWRRSRRKIGFWLQGQILLGFIVGVFTFLGLLILGVEYALTFALVAGLFELIPIFGPILSSVPPIIVALSVSPVLALKVLILYIVIQQFENHLIYPLVVQKVVGIPSILTILALVVGVQLAGFMGILLAVPVVTILVEILNDMDLKKHAIAGDN